MSKTKELEQSKKQLEKEIQVEYYQYDCLTVLVIALIVIIIV